MSKPVITAKRIYNILATLDNETNVFDLGSDYDESALRKALRLEYLQPSKFRESDISKRIATVRPAIVAYKITAEGWDFIHRFEAEWEEKAAKR